MKQRHVLKNMFDFLPFHFSHFISLLCAIYSCSDRSHFVFRSFFVSLILFLFRFRFRFIFFLTLLVRSIFLSALLFSSFRTITGTQIQFIVLTRRSKKKKCVFLVFFFAFFLFCRCEIWLMNSRKIRCVQSFVNYLCFDEVFLQMNIETTLAMRSRLYFLCHLTDIVCAIEIVLVRPKVAWKRQLNRIRTKNMPRT